VWFAYGVVVCTFGAILLDWSDIENILTCWHLIGQT
jgi:hypothetical protein